MELAITVLVGIATYIIGHRVGWRVGKDKAETDFWKEQLNLEIQKQQTLIGELES